MNIFSFFQSFTAVIIVAIATAIKIANPSIHAIFLCFFSNNTFKKIDKIPHNNNILNMKSFNDSQRK